MITYCDWQNRCHRVYEQLRAVGDQYLNEEGKERKRVYFFLWDISTCFDTAAEMVEFIEDENNLDRRDIPALRSFFAESPLAKLRDIAAAEN